MHWGVSRMKTVLDNVIQRPSDIGEVDLFVGMENVESWTGRLIDTDLATAFDSQCKAFEAGDILFGKLRPYLAKVVKANRQGVCVGEFLVLRAVFGRAHQDYMEYLLRSKPVISQANSRTYGARMPRANWVFLSSLRIPLPPPTEQAAIARFLDYVNRRVGRLVDAKERLLGLLEELRASTISEAVTGQIDVRTGQPYPGYRLSGVEWLGPIPSHWEVLPGRVCLQEKKESNVGMVENVVLSLSYGKIVVKPPAKLRGLVPESFETYQIVDPFDIVVRPTDLQNDQNSLRFGLSRHRGIITSAYLCFRTTRGITPKYGHLLLHSYDLMKVIYMLGSGLRQNLSWRDFKYLPCLVPPLSEQIAVVEYLERVTAKTDTAITNARREIELLQEYCTRMIADVVTGKVDVREAVDLLEESAA